MMKIIAASSEEYYSSSLSFFWPSFMLLQYKEVKVQVAFVKRVLLVVRMNSTIWTKTSGFSRGVS